MVADKEGDLRARVDAYLRSHHVMTLATVDREGNAPHAAHVFYVMDERMRLVFLSKTTSLHGKDIGKQAPVAVTVSEEYEDWRRIQGVQLWGSAKLLTGMSRAGALARYSARFPFVKELLHVSGLGRQLRDIAVYRVEPERFGFTDNTSGLFGRETLQIRSE